MNIPNDIRDWIRGAAELEEENYALDGYPEQVTSTYAPTVLAWLDSLPTAPEPDQSQPPEQ